MDLCFALPEQGYTIDYQELVDQTGWSAASRDWSTVGVCGLFLNVGECVCPVVLNRFLYKMVYVAGLGPTKTNTNTNT